MVKWLRRTGVTLLAIFVVAYVGLIVFAYWPHEEVPRASLQGPDDLFLSVDGVTLRYQYHGGPQGSMAPILWIHGFANSLQSFRHVVPLASEYGPVIAVDMAGFGLSDKPVEFDYRNGAQAKLLARFLDTLDLTGVIVAGPFPRRCGCRASGRAIETGNRTRAAQSRNYHNGCAQGHPIPLLSPSAIIGKAICESAISRVFSKIVLCGPLNRYENRDRRCDGGLAHAGIYGRYDVSDGSV